MSQYAVAALITVEAEDEESAQRIVYDMLRYADPAPANYDVTLAVGAKL